MRRIINSIHSIYRDNNQDIVHRKIFCKYYALVTISDPYTYEVLKEFRLIKNLFFKTILTEEYFDYICGIDWNKLNAYLKNELDQFKRALVIYLKEYVPLIFITNNSEISKKTSNQLKSIKPNHILTFNYSFLFRSGHRGGVGIEIAADVDPGLESVCHVFLKVTVKAAGVAIIEAVAEADHSKLHAIRFDFIPVDVALPLGNIDALDSRVGRRCGLLGISDIRQLTVQSVESSPYHTRTHAPARQHIPATSTAAQMQL